MLQTSFPMRFPFNANYLIDSLVTDKNKLYNHNEREKGRLVFTPRSYVSRQREYQIRRNVCYTFKVSGLWTFFKKNISHRERRSTVTGSRSRIKRRWQVNVGDLSSWAVKIQETPIRLNARPENAIHRSRDRIHKYLQWQFHVYNLSPL